MLEYASIVWSPHTQCDVHKIEMVRLACSKIYILTILVMQPALQTCLQIFNHPLLNADDKMMKLVML